MPEMTIEANTLEVALKTLDIQYERIWTTRVGSQRESQMNYYTGMKQMMEILISNTFRNEVTIGCDEEGRHYICGVDMGKEEEHAACV